MPHLARTDKFTCYLDDTYLILRHRQHYHLLQRDHLKSGHILIDLEVELMNYSIVSFQNSGNLGFRRKRPPCRSLGVQKRLKCDRNCATLGTTRDGPSATGETSTWRDHQSRLQCCAVL